MEGICITHSCIPLYTVYMQHIMAHSGGMQEWVIQIPSIPILVSVLFPSLHLKYFRINFCYYVCSFVAIYILTFRYHDYPGETVRGNTRKCARKWQFSMLFYSGFSRNLARHRPENRAIPRCFFQLNGWRQLALAKC